MSTITTPRMKDLFKSRESKCGEVKVLWDAIGDEQPTKEQKDQIKTLNKQIEDIEQEAKELRDTQELKSQSLNRGNGGIPLPVEDAGDGISPTIKKQLGAPSLGERFTTDDVIKSWLKDVAPNGNVQSGQFNGSPRMVIDGMKALITGLSDTSGGALIENDRKPIVDPGTFYRPLALRDLVTQGETTSDQVTYVRQKTHVNNAGPVPEATSTSDALAAKPESAMVLEIVNEVVKTIAHWIPATRRSLADASQIRTLIDTFLRYGLEEMLERQMVTGDGVGENFLGILNVPGISSQPYATDLLTTTRKGRTKVKLLGRAMANGYLLHPNDWEAMDLLTDNENRYYFGGPSVLGTPRLWGLPVIETEGITEGVGLVADWRLAVLWDRMQGAIYTSDSHQDFFIKNLIAILAELRAAFGVIRPAAFVSLDLTP